MRYTLKDYQAGAVGAVLDNLAEAREIFHHPRRPRTAQFALTAATGAGKTVMAAAAIEALFFGDDEFDFRADPSAVVLWFSDDPSLNEQTRFRLLAASDKLHHHNLVVIQHPFSLAKLAPGKVYFLNTQRLSRTSLLTRGYEGDDEDQLPALRASARPDLQGYTIWDTLRNTIEDPDLTLYMVLDEAHRGFGTKASRDKPTIVRRLINGQAGVPPVPVVWGISATVARFDQAMAEAGVSDARRALDKVVVDPVAVQESGLLKDTIVLDIPAESGQFDTVLLARATRKIIDSTAAWAEYARTQATGETASTPVVPLMVLQLPNTPETAMVTRALDVLFQEWPDLTIDAVAHVLGEHTTQTWGKYQVRYSAPERVQDNATIRVLLAKDAISTGWDCPRAEVLVSFRPAKDATHITQLLGRMVRTPLAMRIPGNEKLNSVECLLPFFDRKTATAVVQILTGALDDFPGGGGQKIIIDPQEMRPNGTLGDDELEAVMAALEAVPSQSLPRKAAKPVKRLMALAQALATDGIVPDAGKGAHAELHAVLDGCAARYKGKLDAAVAEIWKMEGLSVAASGGSAPTYAAFVETADDRAIRDAYGAASRVFTADLAGSYVDHLAKPGDPDTDDDALRDAFVLVAALSQVPGVAEEIDREAEKLAEGWLGRHRVEIKDLSDERQAVYNDVRAMSTEPQRMAITRPKVAVVETKAHDDEGNAVPLPTRLKHLLADDAGGYPVGALNDWEIAVLDKEMGRKSAVAWYRNPSRASQEALGIAYGEGDGPWRMLRPDFLFFGDHNGAIKVSIVDPHSHHLADALPKLKGLAAFAKEYGGEFHRIEAISQIDGQTRALDMQDPAVRAAVGTATEALALYSSAVAVNY